MPEDQKTTLDEVVVLGAPDGTEAEWAREEAVCAGVELTRELVTEPANVIYPESFVARCQDRMAGTGLEIRVLDDDEMAALGRFFAKQPVTADPVKDAPLASVGAYLYAHGNKFSGVPACASCHGVNATGTDSLPRLAGQHAAYTEGQLKQFSQRERANDNSIMHSVAVKMTALEMAAVAEYLSGK